MTRPALPLPPNLADFSPETSGAVAGGQEWDVTRVGTTRTDDVARAVTDAGYEAHDFSPLWRGAVTLATKLPWLGDTAAVRQAAHAIARGDALREERFNDFAAALHAQYKGKIGDAALQITHLTPKDFLSISKMQHARRIAENLSKIVETRQLGNRIEMNVWNYKNIFHPGHVSLSLHRANADGSPRPASRNAADQYISWWPGTGLATGAAAGALIGRVAYHLFGIDNAMALTPYPSKSLEEDGQDLLAATTIAGLTRGAEITRAEAALANGAEHPPSTTGDRDSKANEVRALYPTPEQAEMGGSWGRLPAARIAMPFAGNNHITPANGASSAVAPTPVRTTFGLNPRDIDAFWEAARSDENRSFSLISKQRSCAGMATMALKAGGAEGLLPLPTATFFLDPDVMESYATALMREAASLNTKAELVDRSIGKMVAANRPDPEGESRDGAPAARSTPSAADSAQRSRQAIASLPPTARAALLVLNDTLASRDHAPATFSAQMAQMKALVNAMHAFVNGPFSLEINTALTQAYQAYDALRTTAHEAAEGR